MRHGGTGSWQWWRQPIGGREVASMVKRMREAVHEHDAGRRRNLSVLRAIYLDRESDFYDNLAYRRDRASRYPLTGGAVDATLAQMITNRPRPKVVTIAGDYHAQRKAELRQQFIDGEYERLKVHRHLAPRFALDMLQYGTGVLKVGTEDDKIVVDRVWCGELWADPREQQKGRVRTLYQFHAIDRSTLMEMYPEHAEQIEHVSGIDPSRAVDFPDLYTGGDLWQSPDLVEVVEAWRLQTVAKPTRREKGEESDEREECPPLGAGRHVVVIPGLELPVHDEPWDGPFPFVFAQWGLDSESSIFGIGMVERAAAMQSDLNDVTATINETYDTFVPQLWVDASAGVETTSLTDVTGAVNKASSQTGNIRDAVAIISGTVGPELLNREATLGDRFLPVLGVDVLGAAAEKPAGLDSGEALRNYKDFTSQRHILPGRSYEDAIAVDLADLIFWWADRLTDAGKAVKVYGGKLGLQLIDYHEAKPEREDEIYRVRVKPGSMLPKDVSGRIQTILDMQAAGLPIDAVQLAELLEMPDTDALLDRLTVGRDLVRRAIDQCAKLDEPQPVGNPFWPRQWALDELVNAIQRAEYDGADEETQERLRALHGQILSLPDPNAPPMAATPPAAPMPMPGGSPLAPGAAPMLPADAGLAATMPDPAEMQIPDMGAI